MQLTPGLQTAKDLHEKLKRDAGLLQEEVTSDRFFNFVITGWSLVDWVQNDTTVPLHLKCAVVGLRNNQWLKVCGDLATAAKHFALTRRRPVTARAESQRGL